MRIHVDPQATRAVEPFQTGRADVFLPGVAAASSVPSSSCVSVSVVVCVTSVFAGVGAVEGAFVSSSSIVRPRIPRIETILTWVSAVLVPMRGPRRPTRVHRVVLPLRRRVLSLLLLVMRRGVRRVVLGRVLVHGLLMIWVGVRMGVRVDVDVLLLLLVLVLALVLLVRPRIPLRRVNPKRSLAHRPHKRTNDPAQHDDRGMRVRRRPARGERRGGDEVREGGGGWGGAEDGE